MRLLLLSFSFFMCTHMNAQGYYSKQETVDHFNSAIVAKNEKKYEVALHEFLNVANHATDAVVKGFAEFELAMLYINGLGCTASLTSYAEHMIKAAKYDFTPSFVRTGELYWDGVGVQRNLDEAVKWITKSANSGDSEGCLDMGIMYEYGEGVSQNLTSAVYWYKKGAEKNGTAAYNVAIMYCNGRGVERNFSEAYNYFEKAAHLNHDIALYTLGLWYMEGSESLKKKLNTTNLPYFSKDINKALQFFKQSAALGYSKAQIAIANLTGK